MRWMRTKPQCSLQYGQYIWLLKLKKMIIIIWRNCNLIFYTFFRFEWINQLRWCMAPSPCCDKSITFRIGKRNTFWNIRKIWHRQFNGDFRVLKFSRMCRHHGKAGWTLYRRYFVFRLLDRHKNASNSTTSSLSPLLSLDMHTVWGTSLLLKNCPGRFKFSKTWLHCRKLRRNWVSISCNSVSETKL